MAKRGKKPLPERVRSRAQRALRAGKEEFPEFVQASAKERRGARGAVLKLLRSMPAYSKLAPHERNRLIVSLVDTLRKEGITPKHLGGTSYQQAALLLMELREVVGYSAYTLAKLKESRRGLVHAFKGKLFELFVHNSPELDRDFMKMGEIQRRHFLNDIVARRRPGTKSTTMPGALINAKGADVEVIENFAAPKKVTKIWIHDGKGNREFIDIPYVCLSRKRHRLKKNENPYFVSPVVSTEIKTRGARSEGALKGAGPQVSEHLARWGDAKAIGMEIDGVSHSFVPGDVVFNPAAHLPVVVSTARSQFPEYEIRTSRVGSGEAFLLVGIPVDTKALNKIVGVLFPP
jgi:hypothetical protein